MWMTPGRIAIDCVLGDISAQPGFDVVVNAANAQLQPGGGVAGALHRVAGPELERACAPLAPIRPGQAVITPAYGLPNKHVIHCLGPIYGLDHPASFLLAKCYERALRLAEEHKATSIAFPAISTGAFGYPLEEAAEVAFHAVLSMSTELRRVQALRFVLHDMHALKIFQRSLIDTLAEQDLRTNRKAV